MIKLMAFFFGVSFIIGALTLLWQGAQPGVTTTTTAVLADSTTDAVGVNNLSGFKTSGGILVIGNEVVQYTGTSTAGSCPAPIPGSSPCFTGLTRSLGEIAPQNHALGARVYDEAASLINLSDQHSYTIFTSDLEEGAQVSLNPLTWKDAMTAKVGNFVPTFLDGNWGPLLWVFIFFQGLFFLAIALLLIGIVRGVRLF